MQSGEVHLQLVEEEVGRAEVHSRQPLTVSEALQAVKHVFLRAAAAIAVPEQQQTVWGVGTLLVVALVVDQGLHIGATVVGVGGRKVCQHVRAV